MNISDVYVFKKVASSLSFTRAAREIGISRSAVSKQVTRLENALGVVLFNRNTRSVNLTEAGRTFDNHTSNIDTAIEEAAELVRNSDLSPLGTVALTVPSSLGSTVIGPMSTEFRQRWPELHLNLSFDDSVQDVIAQGHDLAIRISDKLPDSSLIARRIGTTKCVLVASPQYLEENGIPKNVAELKKHRCLGIGRVNRANASWSLKDKDSLTNVPVPLAMSADNSLMLVLAACLNSGIIYVPEICIVNELANRKLQIIPDIADQTDYGVYAVYPHRNAATKVKIVVDFIETILARLSSTGSWTEVTNGAYAPDDDPEIRSARPSRLLRA